MRSPKGKMRPRWQKSLVVLLLAALALVGLTGLASAGSEPLPVRFTPAQVLDGDRGRYDLSLEGSWRYAGKEPGQAFPAYVFEHRGRGHVLDADASWQVADRFGIQAVATTTLPETVHSPTWFDATLEAWHDPDGMHVATHGGEALAHLGPQKTPLGVRQDGMREDRTHEHWTYALGPERDCLLFPPLASSLAVGDTWKSEADCILATLVMRLPAGTMFEAVGTAEVRGNEALEIVARSASTRATWLIAPDLPYPLQATFSAPGLLAQDRTATFDLVGFERGQGAPKGMPVTQPGATPLTLAPRQIHGPEDGDIQHPYPLSQAYDDAAGSQTYTDLRAWRLEHPDAYVFKAAHSHREDDDGIHHTWQVHLSDGEEGFSFEVTSTTTNTPAALAPLLGDRQVEIVTLPTDAGARHAPAPSDAPATMPTVRSLWARWSHHAPPAFRTEGANQWSFLIHPQGDGFGYTVIVGHATSLVFDGDGLVVAASEKEAASLVTFVNGRALAYEQFEREAQAATLLEAPEAPPPAGTGFALAELTPLGTRWSAPSATQAAGIGIVAVFAAVGYYLWPLLKTLPGLGLFSRIRPDALLEHPVRQTLMDALHGEPGLHFRALAKRVQMEPGQIRHHVRKLVEGGLVVERRAPGYTCYFPAQGTSRHVIEAAPVVRAAGAKDLLGAVAATPGRSGKELAAAAGLSPATANYHLKRLQEAGLVESKRAGRSLAVHLTPQGRDAMQHFAL